MNKQEIYARIAQNPEKALGELREELGFKELCAFVREEAMANKICLPIAPTRKWELDHWKVVSTLLSGEIVDNPDPHSGGDKEPLGLFEMPFHPRKASWHRRKDGSRGIRGACLVRADKAPPRLLAQYRRLLDLYNEEVAQKAHDLGVEFITVQEWVEERGYSL